MNKEKMQRPQKEINIMASKAIVDMLQENVDEA
jgi:hypothetical protein